ncbi:formate dehydrogenase subunit alpha [Parasporobacterium paucivorans]|uniref:NAD-dependent formate dehydrogenase catalytic subunit n=1 Tax=Parasporobacterium paucivorans DSM 15970 TaxID=1122934 RepID=A0A1M6ETH7_9FIRM|nr:formate dehydrogenase subunit alpha [Parasporobacterium paucivorans]SHI88713.1 NAD-dependent formate dehydrogenase catalytic subunit [Parasporobacterium paucivorans DSM 15970]
MKNVNIEIDGIKVTVPEETTILKAAESIGIEIPTLCYLKDLTPDGSCRMCVVEVKGGRKKGLFTACSEHCAEGMQVETRSEAVIDSRRFILDMLMSIHEKRCLTCRQNSHCQLQELCMEYGVEDTTYPGDAPRFDVDTSNPFFDFDPNACIMCRKCERVCTSLQGRKVISINGRGIGTHMSMVYDIKWSESNCESCGNCVANCPTGALLDKKIKGIPRLWDVKKVGTTCPHCGVGCQYNLIVKDDEIIGTEALEGPSNRGMLCVKGRYGSFEFVKHPDRIKYPLIKRNGEFQRASWDEALDLIAAKILQHKKESGPDAIAGFSCSRSTNEDNYVFQKMMRAAIGTNNVDNCARLCHGPSVVGLATTLGSGAMTNSIADIMEAPEVIFLIGSNTTEAHPVIGIQIRQAVLRGAKLIVADPRAIDLMDYTYMHMQIRPGTNVAFANGIMNVIISNGLEDQDYIAGRTEGYEELKDLVKEYTPEKVAQICGIDKEMLIEAALMYAKADRAPIIYCLGVTEHSTGTEGVMSMSNMALLVGKLGKYGCGVNPLRGQNNVQGACDMGCLPGDFPGYQKTSNPDNVSKFEKAWGCTLSTTQGLRSTEVFPAILEDRIKALYIFGEDPAATDPDSNHIRKALEKLDFLVVQELFMTETAKYADVILPGASYAQKEGTFTNTERRVQRVRKAVELEGEMRLDSDVFCDVMTRIGYPAHFDSAADIMREVASVTPSFAGVSHERLDGGESLQWPCTSSTDKGTCILHMDEFTRGRGLFKAIEFKEPDELPDAEYPLTMITGRMLYHYNNASMTGRTEGIVQISNESYVEINAQDAEKMNIRDGEKVKICSRRGEVITSARIGNVVSPNEVFMTFHFADGNVNEITNSVTDELSGIPEYKVCAVKIEKA